MQTLNITGHVGKRVSFVCSDWNTWTNVKSNVKYLCISPCTADKHIIIKAESGRTKRKDRIELINRGQDLFVSITHLQMSDSKKYFCGVERPGLDLLREVNLKVTDGPRTTVKTVTVDSTVSFTDMSSSTMSSGSSDITNLPMSYTTAPAASGAGNALYLTLGLIFIISIAVVLLILVRKMMKKQLMVVTTPQEDIGESVGLDGVYQTLHKSCEDRDQVYSTLTPISRSAGPEGVYQTLHPPTKAEDQVYSTLTPAKRVRHFTQPSHNFH
ncbi:uncharacterized protein LOC108886321 isoform X1 [Lates calcarifer]|uniref:Uncharacterized protein LOC108886321 isoform X1 n=2 Tax=Lates calcarifer TaxID=8187 RepID=A0AAJ7V5L7_LATCA|nr:uncharacterized protein LOC108886321 isoform X1 [Lates calcarifer]